jgi:uncharacterized protein (TIGR03000 family)
MFRRIFALCNLGLLAALGSLVAPNPSMAQQGEHLYQWSGGWDRVSPNTSSRVASGEAFYATPSPYYSNRAYANASSTQIQSADGYVSTSVGGNGSAVNRAALINVSVAADAEIWFNDAKTKQRGESRQFVSPPVIPGRDYFYEIKATWMEDGKKVTRSRRVTVHAGDVIHVSFGLRHAALGAGGPGYHYTYATGPESRSYYYAPETLPLRRTSPSRPAEVHLDGTAHQESGFHAIHWGSDPSDAFYLSSGQ